MKARPLISFLFSLALATVVSAHADLSPVPEVRVAGSGLGVGWDRYVEYIHRMADAVALSCEHTAGLRGQEAHAIGEATVRLTIDQRGEVVDVLGVAADGRMSADQEKALADAVRSHDFGEWSAAMTADLGPQREVWLAVYFR